MADRPIPGKTPRKAPTAKTAAKKGSLTPKAGLAKAGKAAASPRGAASTAMTEVGRSMGRQALLTAASIEPKAPVARAPRRHWRALTKRNVKPMAPVPTMAPTGFTGVPAASPHRVLSFSAGLEQFVAEDPALSNCVERLVRDVTFTVAPRTRCQQPIQEQRGLIAGLSEAQLDAFRPDDTAADRAVARLEELGFKVLRRGRFGITARGPAELVADALGAALQVMAQPSAHRPRSLATTAISDAGIAPPPSRLYLAPSRSLNLRARISESIDHFVFTPPPLFFAPPSALPPSVGWRPIDDAAIRTLLRVPVGGLTGKGVKVGIVDSGFHAHPFYANHRIQRIAHATSTDPTLDEDGHGTAILYNLVATAPDADILALAQSSPPQDSLEEAFDRGVQVLSCSWGYDNEVSFPILEATIRDGVRNGCIVLFAAGNGHRAWPGSMPDVLSIGGVHADPVTHALQASNYASGFISSLYLNRRVPDVCGLCGQIPSGVYILMPTAPGSHMDLTLAGQPYDEFDDTAPDDGWCGASGTSSATPQIAGVVAILLEAAQKKGQTLTPAIIRDVLERTAQPVKTGRNAFGFPASTGVPNVATGYGLVDVGAALKRLRKKGLA